MCKQIGRVLSLPSLRSRHTTIVFQDCQGYGDDGATHDAGEVAGAAALFFDTELTYEVASISLKNGDLCVRLLELEGLGDWDACLTFKVSQLYFPQPVGSLHLILEFLSPPIRGLFPLAPRDVFLLRLCDYLALYLHSCFVSTTNLVLDLSLRPPKRPRSLPFAGHREFSWSNPDVLGDMGHWCLVAR
jgi:hypothetical protein